LKVFSQEWVDAYVKAINDNANYKQAASWWEMMVRFSHIT